MMEDTSTITDHVHSWTKEKSWDAKNPTMTNTDI